MSNELEDIPPHNHHSLHHNRNKKNLDEDEEDLTEKHLRSTKSLDPAVIQNLESQILRSLQSANKADSPSGGGVTASGGNKLKTSVSGDSATSSSSSIISPNISMESFSLDKVVVAPLHDGQPLVIANLEKPNPGDILSPSSHPNMNKRTNGSENSATGGNSCCQIGRSKGSISSMNANGESDEAALRRKAAELAKSQEPLPPLLPPPEVEDEKKICLVLDLDETLVHSSFLAIPNPDFTFVLGNEESSVGVFVCIRPGAEKFLLELGNLYELVIFTASCQPYADYVIDQIDPQRIIKYRLYRDSCTDFGGNFVKDLSRLNRKLEKIIIIDNSPSAYLLQPYNAIAISSWFDEKTDNELPLIMEFLKNSYRIRNIYDLFSPD